MPSQTWLEADEALRAAEVVFQPIHQAFYARETSYAELVVARVPRDAAYEAWYEADNRENGMTLPNKLPAGLTMEMVIEICEADDYLGYCLACGEEAYDIEPDACAYECEICGKPMVYGAEGVLLMFVA